MPADTERCDVLIVEDDAILRLALEEAFADAGFHDVKAVDSIAAAMETLGTHVPRAMVLDVQLADRNDGWGLAELAGSLFEKLPKIVFSTGAPDNIPEEVRGLGEVFAKPYAPEDLVARVAAAIGEAPARSRRR
jgi:DNA-binding response OmpR family regulator